MTFPATGKCSSFGGPNDSGVSVSEGLGLVEQSDLSEWWFDRIFEPSSFWKKAFGLARNLNPDSYYIAMRWAYGSFQGVQGDAAIGFTREQVRRAVFKVSANGKSVFAQAADWGPGVDRLVDCSPALLTALGVGTDDEVTVEMYQA